MNASAPSPCSPLHGAQKLVEHLGLLLQVPSQVRQAAKAPLDWVSGTGQSERTCIDRGTGLMITLRAGSNEGVGIASAAPTGPNENTRHWKRWSLSHPHETGEGLIFGVPRIGDLKRALAFVQTPVRSDTALSELLTRGTVYMATRAEPETGSSWLSIGLGRGQSPREVLAALQQPGIWLQASSALSALIGRPVTAGSRPWSIAVPVAGEARDRGVLRIGSTLWGRLPETSDKSTWIAQQAHSLGYDRCRTESLYSLVAGRNSPNARVGVAAEYDFENNTLIGALYTLRVPDSLTDYSPTLSEMKDEQN